MNLRTHLHLDRTGQLSKVLARHGLDYLAGTLGLEGFAATEINEEDRAWAKELLHKSAALLQCPYVNVTAFLREGDPKRELVAAAEEWGADCIFLGSTGFSSHLERIVLGSVSAAVAARAHCSVEVVRQA